MKKMMMMLVLAGFAIVSRAEVKWSEDFGSASKVAAEQNKYMLLNFTGSDWCGWCIKLDNEVFSQDEFREYAEENLVLVKLDFPRNKQLSPGVVQQNHKLQEQYGVRGYPTILVLASDGSLVQQTGYQPGGPAAYVEHLKSIIAGHKK